MPFRLRKSIKILPGTRLNLTHKGVGLSARAGPLSYSTRGRRKKKKGSCLGMLVLLGMIVTMLLVVLL